MKNVIVASFKEEAKAIEALHKLNELESFGDISIYEHIMVRKNSDGNIDILKQDEFEGWRTLTGMGIGSLLGMLGGPVGFIIGLYTGTAIGAIADVQHFDFAADFITKVGNKIEIGTVTIIAEIEEDSEVFIDNYLKPLGAVIFRSDVDLELDRHTEEQIDEIEAEIAEEREALRMALGGEKEKIQNRIAELQEKRRTKIAEFTNKTKQVEENIKTRAVSSVAEVKAEIEAIGSSISEEVRMEKEARLKRRISRHQETLNSLNSQLRELQV